MPSQSERVEEVFSKAIELPTDKRDSFVKTACEGNEGLQTEILRLLKFHTMNRTSEFVLDRPLVELDSDLDFVAEIAEAEGDIIGRYKLLERIGEGGMGVVYMAEQLEGVRRRVALKIIKLGMDTRQVIARFEAERQAMAMFDHPCITRVLDAGSTSSGRPFFVMELVRGTNIAKYSKNNSLTLDERLRLFISVCHAVQHAHHKGIIHRDLKPSNILVTLYDGVPVPKVIDFGIAKAIGQQRLTDKTLFTRYSSMVGTPQYMSPEQAEMTGIDVDTRSDIYSLGVLLYELVTGSTPIDGVELKELNPVALYETLRDSTVETPSSRIARTENDPLLKKEDRASNSSKQIGNELDWVIMKALSRDRTIRYASANEFAADVKRFLEGDPVLAGPPSKFYRFKSYLKKYRTAAATAVFVTLGLVTATVTCSIFALNAYTANKKLSQVVGQLQENVQQLEVAEKTAVEARNGVSYDSAHAIALEKFGFRFQNQMDDLADKIYPLPFEATEPEATEPDKISSNHETQSVDDSENSEEEGPEPFEDSDFCGYWICTNFDAQDLLKVSEAELLNTAISRLQTTINNRKHVAGRVWEDAMEAPVTLGDWQIIPIFNLSGDSPQPEHTAQCKEFQKTLAKQLVENRPEFYRIVVDEYRLAFGEQDSRVADGLQLLAASLIDIKKYDEASAHLREAAMMGNEEQKKISQALLVQVELKKQQTQIKPRPSTSSK